MKPEHIVEGLKSVAEQLGIRVRVERGNFRGGRCKVTGDDVIVLNRHHIPEVQISILADGLKDMDVDQVYMKPALRRALEESWARTENPAVEIDGSDD